MAVAASQADQRHHGPESQSQVTFLESGSTYGDGSKPCTPVVHIKIAGFLDVHPTKNGINRY